MTKLWTEFDSTSDVLDALSLWLQDHAAVRYELSYHADFLEKKWLASLRPWNGDSLGSTDIDGRGETAHAATIDMFLLADVPKSCDSGITVDDGISVRSLDPRGVARELLGGP